MRSISPREPARLGPAGLSIDHGLVANGRERGRIRLSFLTVHKGPNKHPSERAGREREREYEIAMPCRDERHRLPAGEYGQSRRRPPRKIKHRQPQHCTCLYAHVSVIPLTTLGAEKAPLLEAVDGHRLPSETEKAPVGGSCLYRGQQPPRRCQLPPESCWTNLDP